MIQPIVSAGAASALAFQVNPASEPGSVSPFNGLILMGLIFIIFYFLLIRPASKKQKALQRMIESLKNGDKVITTGGIHGVIVAITDEFIQLRVASNVKIEISRNAVAALQTEGD